jgi:hypothetical protein
MLLSDLPPMPGYGEFVYDLMSKIVARFRTFLV